MQGNGPSASSPVESHKRSKHHSQQHRGSTLGHTASASGEHSSSQCHADLHVLEAEMLIKLLCRHQVYVHAAVPKQITAGDVNGILWRPDLTEVLHQCCAESSEDDEDDEKGKAAMVGRHKHLAPSAGPPGPGPNALRSKAEREALLFGGFSEPQGREKKRKNKKRTFKEGGTGQHEVLQ
eukprot:1159660-Pelagomonas_calceolata.AAC.3